MKIYQSFASLLTRLLADDQAVKLTVDGYMPLSIEIISIPDNGPQLVAIAHTGVQNGDLMRDPEMVFQFHDHGDTHYAEPISFRNDYMGMMQEVYRYDDSGKATHVDPRLKRELKAFARTWFKNLRDQGFLSGNASRNILS